LLDAEIHWVDDAGYLNRDAVMHEIAEDLKIRGERPYVICEGGSNALGALGFVEAGKELIDQSREIGLEFDTVICATGSGGTLAGLAMSGLPADILGVAVCDTSKYFIDRVNDIGRDAKRFGKTLPKHGWDVLDGFQGEGYGLATAAELEEQTEFARATGLFLDPVYTGKAWGALMHLLTTRSERVGDRIVFWHTGGLFGLFGRGAEYQHLV